jgi:peptidyl-tRNA hydrolase
VEFGRIELGVGMQRWSSAESNWVWAWTGRILQAQTGQRWSSAGSNWVRGGVRQAQTGCGHAQVEFGRLELGVGVQVELQSRTGCGHVQVEFSRIELSVGMDR